MFRIRLPKIGTIVGINEDGSYRQGAIPGLGGPFETAEEFFRAWTMTTEFGLSEEELKEASGPYSEEILASTSSFLPLIKTVASKIFSNNHGPFPLYHGDFGHNNMVFDDNYRLLGVIDWEYAFAAPMEISGQFPLNLSVIPPAMDVPWNYDEEGRPTLPRDIKRLADRNTYITIVKQKEKELGMSGETLLSSVLQDSKRQHVASALRLYQRGKPGWYSRVAESLLEDGEA